jgi:hypothetical protein
MLQLLFPSVTLKQNHESRLGVLFAAQPTDDENWQTCRDALQFTVFAEWKT